MDLVAGYRLTECIHRTPRRAVWRAVREADDRPVYIKRSVSEHPPLAELARLRHEHCVLRELDLPSVIRTEALEVDGNGLALVVEDFGGRALSSYLSAGPLTIDSFLQHATALAAAVAQLHGVGMIHRDINPANIAVHPKTGELRLLDFELAEQAATAAAGDEGAIVGTLAWIAPEQTGRLRLPVDERSDLYSVGATFYAMLTGHPPFEGADAGALVHAHLARRPAPLDVPDPLGDIVLRLLSKHPDDRYQSATGLFADLQRCRTLHQHASLASFPLGQEDRSHRFRVPTRLYGREEPLGCFDDAIAQAGRGALVFVRVSGWSGVGKTALVEAASGRVLQAGGRYVGGKYEQYRRGEPYRGLLNALRRLLVESVAAGGEGAQATAARLSEVLSPNAAVLMEDLPELASLLGPQPPVEEVLPTEARRRYERTLLGLVGGLTSPEAPLMLFLDDLQWADPGSLGLLQALFVEHRCSGLILVGAWRDNEVDEQHPLRRTLTAIQEAHGEIIDLHLAPLRVADVSALLSDATGQSRAAVADLASELHRGSGGNPFFLRQLIEALYGEGMIRPSGMGFSWDLEAIAARPLGDHVGELVAERLGRLEPHARDLVSVAACLGVHVELSRLAAAVGEPAGAVAHALDQAAAAGLVQLEGPGWKLLRSAEGDEEAPAERASLRFVHDAVQTSAYELTRESERPGLHLRVARLLLGSLADQPELLLSLVEHFARARDLITDPAERLQVAGLHAQAGARALASAAFAAARGFFDAGCALLPDSGWEDAGELAWGLHAGSCQAATLLGDFDAGRARLDVLRQHIASPPQAFDVFGLDMTLAHHEGNLGGVVEIGLAALEALGNPLARFPSQEQIGAGFAELTALLEETPLDQVVHAPWTDDPIELAVQKFLYIVGPCAYLTQQSELWQHLLLTMTARGLKNGVTPFTSYALAGMAMIVGGGLGMHEQARLFGEASLQVADASGLLSIRGMSRFLVGGFTVHWTRPLPDAVAVVDEGYTQSLDAGDVIYASWSLASGAISTTLAGESLPEAVRRAEQNAAFAGRYGLVDNAMFLDPIRQFARALAGETSATTSMEGEGFSEAEFVQRMEGRFFRVPLHVYHVLKGHLALLGGDVAGARRALEAAEPVVATSFAMPILAEHASLEALVRASECSEPEGPAWERLLESRETLAKQAASGPAAHRAKVLLIDAELARIRGDLGEALPLYERAMDAAMRLGSHWYAAIAAERASSALVRAGSPRAARAWRGDAAHAWLRMGADGRARELGLDPDQREATQSLAPTGTITVRGGVNLDLDTVLKGARSIAGELQLDSLLARLSHLAMESAGAETVYLLLSTGSGLRLASRGETTGRFHLIDAPIEEAKAPSEALVRLVTASREPVVVADAQDDSRFAQAEDLKERGVRSMMGVPLLHQGRMQGMLVLENNLAPGVFTAQRLELLRMLSSQIAVALLNAQLVEELRELNAAYARFVPQQFLRLLGRDVITEVRLGDAVEREMMVLFADIRSFTTLSEGRSPAANVEFINEYLRHIGPTIRTHGGFIDQYIGDGIMALFPGAAEDAVRAAVSMRKALLGLNKIRAERGEEAIRIGIGLHRGRAMLGTIGEAERMDGTVIADAVNTASRVESLTKEVGCTALLTDAVVDGLPGRDSFLTRYVGHMPVKGRVDAVSVFELFEGDKRDLREGKWAEKTRFEAAVHALEAGRLDKAADGFRQVLDRVPLDAVAARLLTRTRGT